MGEGEGEGGRFFVPVIRVESFPGGITGYYIELEGRRDRGPGCKWSGLAEYASVTGTLTNTTDYTGGYLHGISYSRDRFNAAASFRP